MIGKGVAYPAGSKLRAKLFATNQRFPIEYYAPTEKFQFIQPYDNA